MRLEDLRRNNAQLSQQIVVLEEAKRCVEAENKKLAERCVAAELINKDEKAEHEKAFQELKRKLIAAVNEQHKSENKLDVSINEKKLIEKELISLREKLKEQATELERLLLEKSDAKEYIGELEKKKDNVDDIVHKSTKENLLLRSEVTKLNA
eukprot:12632316-Ditylum_brightwellii.AAC.1